MPRLTKREHGFVLDVLNGQSGVAAAMQNYKTTSYASAGAIASETLKKPRIQEAMRSLADQIPDELVIERLLELLNKRDMKTLHDYVYNTKTGEQRVTTKQVDIGPHIVVAKALDMIFKNVENEKSFGNKDISLVGIRELKSAQQGSNLRPSP